MTEVGGGGRCRRSVEFGELEVGGGGRWSSVTKVGGCRWRRSMEVGQNLLWCSGSGSSKSFGLHPWDVNPSFDQSISVYLFQVSE